MTGAPARHVMYFEDLVVGERETTPAMTITEAHVALYRGLTGDDVAPAGTVPDLLPLCLCTGLGWRVNRPPLAVLAFMSIDWQIARPLRVGDTVHCRLQTAAKRSLRDAGVIIETQEVRDHRGDLVQSGRFTFMIAKRPAPSP